MDPQVERRYELIERRAAAAEARSNAEFAKWKLYMAGVDARLDRAEARMERDEARMAKYDMKFEATRKLVEGGMKFVMRNHADIKTLNKRMDDFARTFRNGGNGNGHSPKRKP